MPVVFVGHGSPINAIEENQYVEGWRDIASSIPRPKAILSISAHWETQGIAVTAITHPQTIHDFGGFPSELYEMQYPALGDPALAERVKNLINDPKMVLDQNWGLDHGTWVVLSRFYPDASIPVIQLSINRSLSFEDHYALAAKLAPLREKGVLILGSGNVVHSFQYLIPDLNVRPHSWAIEFNTYVKQKIVKFKHQELIDPSEMGQSAQKAINTSEHYIPLLYVLALMNDNDQVSFYNNEIVFASLSMLCVVAKSDV